MQQEDHFYGKKIPSVPGSGDACQHQRLQTVLEEVKWENARETLKVSKEFPENIDGKVRIFPEKTHPHTNITHQVVCRALTTHHRMRQRQHSRRRSSHRETQQCTGLYVLRNKAGSALQEKALTCYCPSIHSPCLICFY